MKKVYYTIVVLLAVCLKVHSQGVWNPDNGDGTYTNPILYADYSDPDVCQVGNDFYLTASSFNAIPGLPILHSKDLVNWTIINHAIQPNIDAHFDIPQHGNGVWAPSIRFHDGWFYIYWGDPDRGIFMVKSKDPAKRWSAPVLVKKAYGNIDACPLWDDDGKIYLIHAFAHSRAGINSTLQIVELTTEGDEIIDKGRIVIDGHRDHPTLEGPKFYKRNGFYYIFAPAGGVPTGWQVVFRSKNIYGPYEEKIVLAQGNTDINGPHQGGLVELENGTSWFLHFQDKDAYGRIVHLQPVTWIDDWPVMGIDVDKDGTGEPVQQAKKPKIKGNDSIVTPQTSDEFNRESLGLQWQWSANPRESWYDLIGVPGHLRLHAVSQPPGLTNLWLLPNLLSQKISGPSLAFEAKVDLSRLKEREEAGILVFGLDYAGLSLQKNNDQVQLAMVTCHNADQGLPSEKKEMKQVDNQSIVWVKLSISSGVATFGYSLNGTVYKEIGDSFKIREGKWVGAKLALFCTRSKLTGAPGSVDFDWVRISALD